VTSYGGRGMLSAMNETNQQTEVRFLTGKTAAQRQAAYRARMKAQGFVPVTIFVHQRTRADWAVQAAEAAERWAGPRELWVPVLRNVENGQIMRGR